MLNENRHRKLRIYIYLEDKLSIAINLGFSSDQLGIALYPNDKQVDICKTCIWDCCNVKPIKYANEIVSSAVKRPSTYSQIKSPTECPII